MKKTFLLTPLLALALAGCRHYDDFEFAGVVVDYEMCTNLQDLGYVVQIASPDTIGGTYTTSDGSKYPNVVVIYYSDRLLHDRDSIGGRIYFDNGHSKSQCNYHYRETTGDVPEACFSKLTVLKGH